MPATLVALSLLGAAANMSFPSREIQPFAANETQDHPGQYDKVAQVLVATVLLQPVEQLAENKQGGRHTL